LSRRFVPDGSLILSRVLKASAVGESAIDQKIGALIRTSTNPTLGILAQAGEILIRITAKARDRSTASAMLDEMELRVREHVGDHLFGKDGETLEEVVTHLLESQGKTICVVETGTGGAVAQRLVATDSRSVLGFEILPHISSVRTFLSANDEHCDDVAADPSRLAQCLASAARRKYSADVSLVVLEATRCGLARSWVLVQNDKTEHLRDVGLKGCDNWSQHRLANVALEIMRRTLLKTAPLEQRRS
jgi:nicotinamide-nucleotide amidase